MSKNIKFKSAVPCRSTLRARWILHCALSKCKDAHSYGEMILRNTFVLSADYAYLRPKGGRTLPYPTQRYLIGERQDFAGCSLGGLSTQKRQVAALLISTYLFEAENATACHELWGLVYMLSGIKN